MAQGMNPKHSLIFRCRVLLPQALVVCLLVLTGCSEVRQAIGIEKTPPDEFRVRVRAPLSMPPDFGIKAPRPGSPGSQSYAARDVAEQIIIESDKSRAGKAAQQQIKGLTRQETTLITRLGGDKVSSDIRRVVETETAAIYESEKGFVESIMFWKEPPPPGKAVDPRKEARRIQENQALGRRADTGKTPVIERKSKGLFSKGLFKDLF